MLRPLWGFALALGAGCHGDGDSDTPDDSDTPVDTDTVDTDTGVDTDTSVDTDTVDTDTGVDTDTSVDTDTDPSSITCADSPTADETPVPTRAWLSSGAYVDDVYVGGVSEVDLTDRTAQTVLALSTSSAVVATDERLYVFDASGARGYALDAWSEPVVAWSWADGIAASALLPCGDRLWAEADNTPALSAYAPDTGALTLTVELPAWPSSAAVAGNAVFVGFHAHPEAPFAGVAGYDCATGAEIGRWPLGNVSDVVASRAHPGDLLVRFRDEVLRLDPASGDVTEVCHENVSSTESLVDVFDEPDGDAFVTARHFRPVQSDETGYLAAVCVDAAWNQVRRTVLVASDTLGVNLARPLGGDGAGQAWVRGLGEVLVVSTTTCSIETRLPLADTTSITFAP